MKNKKVLNLIKLSLVIFTVFSFINILPAQALPDIDDPIIFQPQVGLPGLVDKGQQITLTRGDTSYLALMVKGFYNYGLGIAGILAAIVLMFGGIIWLTSAGSSDKISQAKGLIGGSLTGLLLIFGSWIILKTINPNLVDFRIKDITPISEINLTTCCEYISQNKQKLAREGLPKDECAKLNGDFTQNGKAVVRPNGDKKCAASGCCLCTIGGGWSTVWVNVENSCTDKTESNVDISEDMCKASCEMGAQAFGLIRQDIFKGVVPSWEYSFKWDHSCDDGACVQNTGGAGSSF